MVAALLAAFVAAVVVAALLADHVYRSEQATAASLRETVAVLSWPGAVTETPILHQATAMATWQLSDGATRSGLLTTDVVPGIYGQPAGAVGPALARPDRRSRRRRRRARRAWPSARRWRGWPSSWPPPPCSALCYRLCQRGLDRRRLANWSSAWAVTGPQWTSRQ